MHLKSCQLDIVISTYVFRLTMEKLLIVDDDAGIRSQLRWGLGKSYQVLLAEDAQQALEQFRTHQPKVVSLDLGLPPDVDGASEGLRVLSEIIGQGKGTKVVVVSGNEDRANALKAIETRRLRFLQQAG